MSDLSGELRDRVIHLEKEVDTLEETVTKLAGLINRLSAVVEGMLHRSKDHTQILNELTKAVLAHTKRN